ncbi:hypothetical protein [Streptomyces sp. NRRL S-31]|uniref:hypothetical protein n=1 Tax=Streptomyces sp. NRRL S-31 TaxID=1463898 RepID=UPI00069BA87E|nr:hypothetical protein [Streptomyces sp. NRRL S-31]
MLEQWEIAASAEEVHALLGASDAYAAERHGLPVPRRNMDSSRGLVEAGVVRMLRVDGEPAAMFTLTWKPTFTAEPGVFPPARRPVYLQRLAVRPEFVTGGRMLGLMCMRKAMEEAAGMGADALRAETNPDLGAVVQVLESYGFRRYGEVETDGWMRRVRFQYDLA